MSKPSIAVQLDKVRVVMVEEHDYNCDAQGPGYPCNDLPGCRVGRVIEVVGRYDSMGDPCWAEPEKSQEWRFAATMLAGELLKERQEVSA